MELDYRGLMRWRWNSEDLNWLLWPFSSSKTSHLLLLKNAPQKCILAAAEGFSSGVSASERSPLHLGASASSVLLVEAALWDLSCSSANCCSKLPELLPPHVLFVLQLLSSASFTCLWSSSSHEADLSLLSFRVAPVGLSRVKVRVKVVTCATVCVCLLLLALWPAALYQPGVLWAGWPPASSYLLISFLHFELLALLPWSCSPEVSAASSFDAIIWTNKEPF